MDAQLSQGLTFLAWTSGIFLIVVGIFVIKLLFDLSRLTCNMNKSAEIVKNEITGREGCFLRSFRDLSKISRKYVGFAQK